MPKIPSIPRISIAVPIGSDVQSFEDTLVSVLEHRPAGSEILVVHDGNYDDPFQLAGEVRFVFENSSNQVDLIAAGARAARGRFVHVLTPGFQAIEDWTEPALDQLDRSDVAAVAPVICQQDGVAVVAAGWRDGHRHLCQPNMAPQFSEGELNGAYLQASFWRRDVLRSLTTAFQSKSITDSTYAFGLLVDKAGWRCVLEDASVVTSDQEVSSWDPSSFGRGRQMGAIRAAILGSVPNTSFAKSMWTAMAQPSTISETLGQFSFAGRIAATKRRLEISEVMTCEQSRIIAMPGTRRSTDAVRRAA